MTGRASVRQAKTLLHGIVVRAWTQLRFGGDRLLDRWFHMDTARAVTDAEPLIENGSIRYEPSNWTNLVTLWYLLRSLAIRRTDVFIDFGCGKGQVLFLAARFPFQRLIGLEHDAGLLNSARMNMSHNRRRFACQTVEFVLEDGANYQIPSDLNICYFYNPFPLPVMETVFANLAASLVEHPREMAVFSLRGDATNVYASGALVELYARHGFRRVRSSRQLVLYVNSPLDGRWG